MGSINIFKTLPVGFLKAALLINLSNINNCFLTKFSGTLGIKPGSAGLAARKLTIVLCCHPKLYAFCLSNSVMATIATAVSKS